MKMIHPKRLVDVAALRAAWWTVRAARTARRRLASGSVDVGPLTPVPQLPPRAERGVFAVLRRSRYTCLVRALVLQAWYAAHGDARDVVIGVTSPADGFRAHAWLEGDPPHHEDGYEVLTRRPALRSWQSAQDA
jgi:hypothetical protein